MQTFHNVYSDGTCGPGWESRKLAEVALRSFGSPTRLAYRVVVTPKNVPGYKVRRNLLSNRPYLEPEGTPLCCSPASETYWSM